jgi:YD repeat-containing protein
MGKSFYMYDNNGNLEAKTSKANPTEVTTYHWDAQDQLIQIDRPVCAVMLQMAKFGKYRYG